MSLEEAIARRRSIRRYRSQPVSLSQLSQVLWAAQGITGSRGRFRAVPSAGATYPLEIFVLAGRDTIVGLDEGVYRYDVESHSLDLQRKGDLRAELSAAALNQGYIAEAPADIVVCAVYERTARSYGGRAERYVHMEVGHVGQNIHLQAVALGLASVVIGAFADEGVGEILGLERQIRPLYIMPLGKPQAKD
jgi:SagB-type dehydrogenase family enzyme